MYLENCRKELEANGIHSEIVQMQKNAVLATGLRLGGTDEVIRPIIYPRDGEPMCEIIECAKNALKMRTDVDATLLQSWDYVKDHIHLSIQRRSDEAVIKKSCMNLDLVMRVQIDMPGGNKGSVKVTKTLLDVLGVKEEVLWTEARRNSCAESKIRSMGEMIGLEEDGASQLYVVTTDDMTNGAAVLAIPELFRDFCLGNAEAYCFILPSSTEEVIVVPGSKAPEQPQVLAEMVRDINESIVDPVIRLEPVAYRYSLDTDCIEIVAQA